MSTIIDNPDSIFLAGLLQALHALALEVNTGLRHSRANWLVVLSRHGYTGSTRGTVKNKVEGMKWLIDEITERWPGYTSGESVQRALKAVQS